MAMTKCEECGNEISTEAASCPKCGYKPKKSAGPIAWIFAAVLLVGIVSSALNSSPGSSPSDTPEQKAEKEKDVKRYSAAVAAGESIRKALRDPESLKFESMRVNDDASIVCSEYRAKNGFGGYNKAIVAFVNNKGSSDVKTWNMHCTAPMKDLLYAVQ